MTSKLVLFDIDETLICSDGAGRRAIARALLDMFDIKLTGPKIPMSGKTDPEILAEFMKAGGYSEEVCKERIDELLNLYLNLLQEELKNAGAYRLHEGVVELLDRLQEESDVYLGLLTGNIERGARLKLERFGLNRYFPIGAYGSDSGDRMKLPAIARERAEMHYQSQFEPAQLVIIGDSVKDILCAHGYGASVIAVNTGVTSWQELEALKPNFLLPTLKDTTLVLQAIKQPLACPSKSI